MGTPVIISKPVDLEQIIAIEGVLDLFTGDVEGLVDHFTCSEAAAVATFLAMFGKDVEAICWLEMHAETELECGGHVLTLLTRTAEIGVVDVAGETIPYHKFMAVPHA